MKLVVHQKSMLTFEAYQIDQMSCETKCLI